MNNIQNMAIYLFEKLLTDRTRKKTENVILKIAIFSFFIHLALIYLIKFNIVG